MAEGVGFEPTDPEASPPCSADRHAGGYDFLKQNSCDLEAFKGAATARPAGVGNLGQEKKPTLQPLRHKFPDVGRKVSEIHLRTLSRTFRPRTKQLFTGSLHQGERAARFA
jgi:hypothetical protein